MTGTKMKQGRSGRETTVRSRRKAAQRTIRGKGCRTHYGRKTAPVTKAAREQSARARKSIKM